MLALSTAITCSPIWCDHPLLEGKYPEPELILADPRERAAPVRRIADTAVRLRRKDASVRIAAPRSRPGGDLSVADAAERDELPPLLIICKSG
jgi:hypothetical protein